MQIAKAIVLVCIALILTAVAAVSLGVLYEFRAMIWYFLSTRIGTALSIDYRIWWAVFGLIFGLVFQIPIDVLLYLIWRQLRYGQIYSVRHSSSRKIA